jgi:hypothetical protein
MEDRSFSLQAYTDTMNLPNLLVKRWWLHHFKWETYKIERETLTHLHHLFTTSYSKSACHKRKGKNQWSVGLVVRHCYIPARVRTQVQSLENALVGRGNHEPRTGLVSPFKKVWGYPRSAKKKANKKKSHKPIQQT